MRICCLVFLLGGIHQTTHCQEKILLKDNFNDNRNGWLHTDNADFKVGIQNGVYHIEKLQKNFDRRGCLWYTKKIPGLNTQQDFSVTLYARFVSGGDILEKIDLMWGKRDDSGKENVRGGLYQLSFFMRGEVWLDYFNSKWTYFVRKQLPLLLENGFKPGDFNKYDFIQKDSFVIFSVNDREVLRQKTDPTPGDLIGFQQCLKCAWEIDSIIVRQDVTVKTPVTKADTTTLPVITNNQQQKEPVTGRQSVNVYPNPFTNTLHIAFSLERDETVNISLVDMRGLVLQHHTRSLQKGAYKLPLYADVPAGAYIVKVILGKGEVVSTTVIRQ